MSTSTLYNTLKAATDEFFASLNVDSARLRACRTSDYHRSYGHNLHVSGRPEYQRGLNLDELLSHMQEAVPLFEAADGEITDLFVDESRKSVVMRTSILLTTKGTAEVVENDMVWFLVMNESGTKVRMAKEFGDSVASDRLKHLFESVKK